MLYNPNNFRFKIEDNGAQYNFVMSNGKLICNGLTYDEKALPETYALARAYSELKYACE